MTTPNDTPPQDLASAQREIERLRAELAQQRELHTMQLAGIMTASMQNTESTVKGRITRDNPYWTQAYEDVCVAIDREIKHRADLAKAQTTIDEDALALHLALLGQKPKDGYRGIGNEVFRKLDALTKDLAKAQAACAEKDAALRAHHTKDQEPCNVYFEHDVKPFDVVTDLGEAYAESALAEQTTHALSFDCGAGWVPRSNLHKVQCELELSEQLRQAEKDQHDAVKRTCARLEAELIERNDLIVKLCQELRANYDKGGISYNLITNAESLAARPSTTALSDLLAPVLDLLPRLAELARTCGLHMLAKQCDEQGEHLRGLTKGGKP